MKLSRRNGTLYLRKRVPLRYASVDPRTIIWISLHTDSETVAAAKATQVWASMIEAWEAKLDGDSEDAEARYRAARNLAHAKGFRFMSAPEVARLPVADIVARVEAITLDRSGQPDMTDAAAFLGAEPPRLTVSKVMDAYFENTADKTRGKSQDQIRRWINPRNKATANLIAVIGDKEIASITQDDMLDFRQWWMEKVDAEGLTHNSANKDFIHLGSMWRTVNKLKRLRLDLPISGLALKE